MLQQIVKTWRRIGRWRNRPRSLRGRVRLEVAALEERCTPANGIASPLDAPLIVQVGVISPAAIAPTPPTSVAVELAKPIVRTDLFCAGITATSRQAIEHADEELSEFSETKPKPKPAPSRADPVQPTESNDVDATQGMQTTRLGIVTEE